MALSINRGASTKATGTKVARAKSESAKTDVKAVARRKRSVQSFSFYEVKIVRSDPDKRIRLLREGFPASVVTDLADGMGWSREHVFEAFRLKRSTVLRKIKEDARLETDESERLLSVMDIIEQVQEMVEQSGTPEGFDAHKWVGDWLDTANHALGGRRPSEYLDTYEGLTVVRRLLAQMQSGAYA